ncbi:TfoX/Sxy family protein [Aquabacter cavernae]|uniref:TfoX/Sxy family protein n=1 Tax=Aquabacter cavernae TaxID=2496029 RepID=UPI001FE1F859|nr:TfoX/Sxy family protein [Aquabacter cavernae]
MLSDDEIGDLFAAFGPVRRKRMFGGAGLYADGLMFALETSEGLFLKADAAFGAELEARGAGRFTYEAKGRRVRLGFWSVPEAVLDDPDDLADLSRRALAVARRAAEAKRKGGT